MGLHPLWAQLGEKCIAFVQKEMMPVRNGSWGLHWLDHAHECEHCSLASTLKSCFSIGSGTERDTASQLQ